MYMCENARKQFLKKFMILECTEIKYIIRNKYLNIFFYKYRTYLNRKF